MICRQSAQPLNNLRDKACDDFTRMGFPTRKVEKYKYTDVDKAFAPDYGLNLNRLDIPVNPYEIFRCDVPNLSTRLYFLVNDQFYQGGKPSESHLPDGVIVDSMRSVAERQPQLLASYFARQADTSSDALTALNTMLSQDGIVVYVPRNTRLKQPLQIINLLHSSVDMMVNRRMLIILEEGAEATLLFCDHAMDKCRFLATQVMEVFVADNGHLHLYELEETHTGCKRFANTYVSMGNDSTANLNSMTLFNGETRNTTEVRMTGQGSELTMNGCVIADKNQRVDNHTLIDHQAPHCISNQLYKYVVDDQAVAAFAGKVLVRKEALKTVSQETNANLCATKEARVYTQPMLEIYADDVKCSHGSTVGVLDEAALFYMRQRGIAEAEARMLLKFAFVGQVIDRITLQPLRDRMHYLVEKRFRGELNKCMGCSLCK